MKLLDLIYILCEEMARAAREDVMLIMGENQIMEVTPEYVSTFVQQLMQDIEIVGDEKTISFISRDGAGSAIKEARVRYVNEGWWVYFFGELDFADRPAATTENGVWIGDLRHFWAKTEAEKFYMAAKEMFTSVFLIGTPKGQFR